MRICILFKLLCVVVLAVPDIKAVAPAASASRLVLNFNPDWRFVKADPAGALAPEFHDSDWKRVSTPHTYNDDDTFDDWSLPGHRGEQNQWSGRTWYRKSFTLPESLKGKKVFLEFEAVRQVAEVYLNGRLLGVSKTGFTPFGFDLTPYLVFGDTPNLLAVMCDNRFMKDPMDKEVPIGVRADKNSGKAMANNDLGRLSAQVNQGVPAAIENLQADQIPWNNPHWHPAHGGIYRNVRLHVTDPLHITLPLYSFLETKGPYAYATDITTDHTRLGIEVPVLNERNTPEKVEVRVEVFDAENKMVLALCEGRSVAAREAVEFKFSGQLANPRLWEPAYPHLYRVVCTVSVAGVEIDRSEIPLGVRAVRWSTQEGFFINGQHVKLHGWGQKPTNEWPGLGAALPDWMHFFTMELMREAGGNFVRWGHCPAGPASISAGDQLGIIAEQPGVDGESDTVGAAWSLRTQAFRDTVIYFRNNPSILIWEGGNQKVTRQHASELRQIMDLYDPHGGRAYAHRRADQVTAEFMDVCIGTEGGREIPELPVVEGEYDREESPRRVWDDLSEPNYGYPEAKGQTYQLTSEQFAVNQVMHYLKKIAPSDHSGGANWIFSDTTSGGRVAVEVARASGEVDGVRLPKEAYYVCRTLFSEDPQVHIIGHWTYPTGTKKTVTVASNCPELELFLNGRSLGIGKSSGPYLFVFPDLIWEPGELKAVARAEGRELKTQIKRSAGVPVALRLTPLRGPSGFQADGSDVMLVDVEAVDAKGERCPTFQRRLDFSVDGPAIWRGGYNSGKIHSIGQTSLDLECGVNRVALRSTRTAGPVVLKATCEGLPAASLHIDSVPIEVNNGQSSELPKMPSMHLPAQQPKRTLEIQDKGRAMIGEASGKVAAAVGHFTRGCSYSGPNSSIVHIRQNLSNGMSAYVDLEAPFTSLPDYLHGADWLQAAQRDALYSAVDLVEISVLAGSTVVVAHDDRLPRPEWLRRQFKASAVSLTILGQTMTLFVHRAAKEESLTLGANTEDTKIKAGNMYLLFVSGTQ